MQTLPYWLPFLASAAIAYRQVDDCHLRSVVLLGAVLVAFIGLRVEVGGDWDVYLTWINQARGQPFFASLYHSDLAYSLLNWLGANFFGSIYFVNSVCGAVAIFCLVAFCLRQANPALAFAIAIPYLVTVVFMGYTRQSAAIGLGMLAMLTVQQRHVWSFLAFVTIAALFHRTAIVLFALAPALFLPRIDRGASVRLAAILIYAVLFALLLFHNTASDLLQNYLWNAGETLHISGDQPASISGASIDQQPASVSGGLQSAGATIRLLQSTFAVVVFSFITTRRHIDPATLWLWRIVSTIVIALFVLSFWRSTIADRVGLFFVPLQLYAFATLPSLFPRPWNRLIITAILLCSGATLWVWMMFGDHAQNWLPYRNLLLS